MTTTSAFLEDNRTGGGEPLTAEIAMHGSKTHITFKPYGRRGTQAGMTLIIDTSALLGALRFAFMDDGK